MKLLEQVRNGRSSTKGITYTRVYHVVDENGKSLSHVYKAEKDGRTLSFEAFESKIAKETEIQGKIIEEHEIFPSDESFGKWAFTYGILEKAVEKANELAQKVKTRETILG